MTAPNDIPGFLEYEANLEEVLRLQLPPLVRSGKQAPLTLANVRALPEEARGAYALFDKTDLVYVGKTDAQEGFRSRLERHCHGIQHRKGLTPTDISFIAIKIAVFHNAAVETMLIEALNNPPWNNSGFGSNDPGHNREDQIASEFDTKHPVDIDIPLDFVKSGDYRTLDFLVSLKDSLPYTFRYETDATDGKKRGAKHTTGHSDQRETALIAPKDNLTMRECMRIAVAALPVGWVATLFPDRVILYKEKDRAPYKNAKEVIA